MSAHSFFHLTPPRPLTPDDALPGIHADEDTFVALIDALRSALDAFQDAHPDQLITWGDCLHATLCLKDELIEGYLEDTADA